MSTITKRLTVGEYDRMIKDGTLPETNRAELIEGRVVAKMVKSREHRIANHRVCKIIEGILPPGWYVGKEDPICIPNRDSEPEPDASVVRGVPEDYDPHPGTEDVVLVVEVSCSSIAADRKLATTYAGGGIPACWIVNVVERNLDVYRNPHGEIYETHLILTEADTVDLVLDGRSHGPIAVAVLLPPP